MGKVILYGTASCIWCARARDFFKKNKIKFSDIDVGKDKNAAEEAFRKSGAMVSPIIDIGGKIIVGFDEPKLKKALKIK